MLIGEFSYTIDQKKRISIPAKFREDLGRVAIVTRGIDNCLIIYSLEEWKRLAEKLEKLPSNKTDARGYARMMLSGAVDVTLDKLGRILIPDYLKKYASLKKNISIIGLSNKIEIWDESEWNKYKNNTEKEVGNIAERLEELEI